MSDLSTILLIYIFISDKKRMAFSVLAAAVVLFHFINRADCQITPPRPKPCTAHSTCETCVRNAKCLWCLSNDSCTEYPEVSVLPSPSVCKLSEARWGLCWVNFEALLIAMAVLAGTIILSITVCCCCCCCCKRRRSGPDRDEETLARKREEISQNAEERKVKSKAKHDEIRRKYGLIVDSDHPYSKFEND
ncbi:pituitary tumor-transforming gene 1 protein-interacting protein [Lampris incognitus]|uniref:pituitary tumor-transforming gene 1 protein-interacting protein n=1 Tax=Lampris incognitus TaxID=2546036 RepID=UPI0024B5F8A5|nr:pituitary tumor-transforming gene 1 protein-interacting protein [Lampris incognitus]